MPENPQIKRYLDAGMAFTKMTQTRAEAIVADLVKAGEVNSDRAQALAADLLGSSERLLDMVRKEVTEQVKLLGLVTRAEFEKLIGGGQSTAPIQAKKATTATSTPAQKAPAQKAPVKKAPAQKAPVKKAPVKKAPVTKAVASSGAKKAPVTKTPVTKAVGSSGAKKATAKKST